LDQFKNNAVHQFPDISKVTFNKIHKDFLKVILITILTIVVVVFVGLLFLVKYKLNETIPEYTTYLYVGVSIVFLLIIIFSIISFTRRAYAIRDKDISYKSGILIKKITTVPFSRIQHVEIDEAPISRLFNLAAISVFTAGDSSDDLVIKGLKKEETYRIKEFITEKINE
jgi:membrane protein YdbS with pleckstrin-like domain